MNFFKAKSKSPAELCRLTKDAMLVLERDQGNRKACEKATEDISKYLQSMKVILYGDGESEPNRELVAQLAQETYNTDLLLWLTNNMAKLEFEAKKDAAQIFNNLLRRQIGTRYPTVEYICKREAILFTLVNGYESESNDIALNSGLILRECIKHEALAKIILYSDQFYKFFVYVDMTTFDVASDAFATFKDLITRHKAMATEFMDANYTKFFEAYNGLLDSNNYVTRRQSLKLLGELLLDRTNFNIMTRFISEADNLKRMMNLLRSRSRNIQLEAFHVFKVFVANPNKSEPILNILLKNRTKLVEFLSKFHEDRTEDEQFNDEKAYIIKQINTLQPLPPKPDAMPTSDSPTTP